MKLYAPYQLNQGVSEMVNLDEITERQKRDKEECLMKIEDLKRFAAHGQLATEAFEKVDVDSKVKSTVVGFQTDQDVHSPGNDSGMLNLTTTLVYGVFWCEVKFTHAGKIITAYQATWKSQSEDSMVQRSWDLQKQSLKDVDVRPYVERVAKRVVSLWFAEEATKPVDLPE